MVKNSRYKRIPLNVAGGSNETRSRAVSVERLVNWYPDSTPTGVSPATLMPWGGLTNVGGVAGSGGNYADRGCHFFKGAVYFVKGTTLYKLSSAYAVTTVGTITGSDYCSFADNGGVMVICNGGTPYSYDGTTLTSLASITFNPSVVTYITTRFVFDSSNDYFYVSDSFSTNVRTANSATSESAPDSFTAPLAFGQMLYLFGENTIEPWQPASGQPPFARATQAIMENVGCSAPHGITNTIDFVYFIHKGGIPYRMRGFQVEPIATSGIINKLNNYDCAKYRARSLSFDGQNFVIFDFYDNNATWCFSETTSTWFELTSSTTEARWQGGSYCAAFGENLFFDNTLQHVYKLDLTNFVNDWGPVVREKVFEFLSGEKAGKVRGKMELSRVILGVEAGCGLVSGQGEEPLIGVQVSIDGKTWNQEQFVELGRMGEFSKQVEVSMRVKFQQLALRVRLYDPVGFAFFSAAIDVREAGH